jgi:hypothetical protein
MLTFNEIKTALVNNKLKSSKVCLALGETTTQITGVYTQGVGELWCIPADKTQNIRVTENHTIVIID